MSTIGDVVHDAAVLVTEFGKLLDTDTAKQAPQIAEQLGARPQLDDAMGKAGAVVKDLGVWVGKAWEVATVTDAAVAIFALLPVMVDGIGAILRDVGDDIASFGPGLERVRDVAAQIGGAVHDVAGLLQVGTDTAETVLAFLDPAAFRELADALIDLAARLAEFGKLPAPADQPVPALT